MAKGDGQVIAPVIVEENQASRARAAFTAETSQAAEKLSAESNKIGMTGLLGGVARVALTTGEGLLHVVPGVWHAIQNDYHHPEELVKTLAGSAILAGTLKAVLPEAGPVGKVASVLMTTWFIAESAPGFADAYSRGLKARTWSDIHESGQVWGDSAGQVALNAGLGYVGFKIGSGISGRALSAERFDDFADAKQDFWDRKTDQTKRLLGLDTSIPTASSIGLRPNYVIEGDRATLLDSHREAPVGQLLGPKDMTAEMNATVMLRGKASVLRMDRYIARISRGRAQVLTDADDAFAKRFGSLQESLDAVKDFAAQHNLSVAESDLRSGRVLITGKTADFQRAFTIKLSEYATDNGVHTGHEGAVSLPKEIAPHVRAVLGTDERPVLAPANRVVYSMDENGVLTDKDGHVFKQAVRSGQSAQSEQPADMQPDDFVKQGGYRAIDIARAQNFPLRTGGEGQHGGFVSLSGGIDLADYNQFFPEHGMEQPRPLGVIEVNGAKNSPGDPNAGDTENVLDAVQMQSVAPRAQVDMIRGNNDDQGLADVFERGVFPRMGEAQMSVISSSWGLAEGKQTPQAINTLSITFRQAAIRGVQILAGAGDNGARANTDSYQPEFPASDPNVTGVGGLKTILNPDGSIARVTAWDEGEHSSTGGGVSNIFRLPYWQRRFSVPLNLDTGKSGRGVPDISTNAAKATGYPVRVNGNNWVIGGTSAGAPLNGGLLLNINAELAAEGIGPVTPLNPWMYARANTSIFHDVTIGGNHGYQAGKGWDPLTGLGWVDGQQMLNAMKINQTSRVGLGVDFFTQGLLMPDYRRK